MPPAEAIESDLSSRTAPNPMPCDDKPSHVVTGDFVVSIICAIRGDGRTSVEFTESGDLSQTWSGCHERVT